LLSYTPLSSCSMHSSTPRLSSDIADPDHSARHRGRGRTGAHGGREGQGDAPRPEARHLRRAWRRPGLDQLLRGSWPRLRLVLTLDRKRTRLNTMHVKISYAVFCVV